MNKMPRLKKGKIAKISLENRSIFTKGKVPLKPPSSKRKTFKVNFRLLIK